MTNKGIFVCYDERMLRHRPPGWNHKTSDEDGSTEKENAITVFETPERLLYAYKGLQDLQEANLKEIAYWPVECTMASKHDILLAHDEKHYNLLQSTVTMTDEELQEINQTDSDLYYCRDTFSAACLAVGGVIATVEAVSADNARSRRGMAFVRPPGHHACACQASGFCFFNNVAVAAKVAVTRQHKQRVLILDWDVHHGDGTQAVTESDPSILYLSLHRLHKHFFPNGLGKPRVGYPHQTGTDGTCVNIGWTKGGMGNAEYAAAFSELLLPIVHSWKPDLVLVSSGLDAAEGDSIGDCCLTTDGYHAMTTSLLAVVGPETPVVVALEGGYELQNLKRCTKSIVAALLGAKEVVGSDALDFSSTQEVRSQEELSSQDEPNNNFEKEVICSDRLEAARSALKAYWDCQNPTGLKSGALDAINKAIRAIRVLPQWNALNLQEISKPKRSSKSVSQPLRQSTRYNLRRSRPDVQEEDLLESLQGLNLG